MTDVVINKTPTSFTRFSEEAVDWLWANNYSETAAALENDQSISRDDEGLVAVVKALGRDAGKASCHPVTVEIPDDVDWHIESQMQREVVVEDYRTWP